MPFQTHPSQVPVSSPDELTHLQKDMRWQGRAARLICLLIGLFLVALIFRYLLPCLLPFLLAWLLSFPVRRGAAFLEKKLQLSRRVCACLLLLLLFLPLTALCVMLVERLLLEAQEILVSLGSGQRILDAMRQAVDFFSRITSHIPALHRWLASGESESIRQQIDATVANMLSEAITRYSAKIPEILGGWLRAFPSTLIFLITFLIPLFYCCTDDGRISTFLQDVVPSVWRPHQQRLTQQLSRVGARWLRAYFLLFLLTFLQLFVGFSVLRLPYVFLPALLISLFDLLPLLGVGTVLIPWGLLSLFSGNTALGSGLLVLCGIVLLVRQLLEPKILGESLGLHPLLTLLSVYAGLRLGGVWGMIAAPAVAVVVRSMWGKKG
ncbi:MAG: sporulation integral membrane protein YtvI [Clostridia bacterium]|nr:sporulation integral membrane protein YtvI [Clostridia bacterium]